MAVPALYEAVRRLGEPVKFVIHTNSPDTVLLMMRGLDVETRPIDEAQRYVALQQAHSDGIRTAPVGSRVVLLNADICVSGNLLQSVARHFNSGKKAVVLIGIRTAAGDEIPPAGADPRELLLWAWEHRHQIVRDTEFPYGRSALPTNLFWTYEGSTVARGFHLHPVAILKEKEIDFKSTIDGDLLELFPRNSIHVVTDPDDCSMCEVSPPERRFPLEPRDLTAKGIAIRMSTRASPLHRWLFEHRIVVRGRAEEVTEDCSMAVDILSRLQRSSFMPKRLPR